MSEQQNNTSECPRLIEVALPIREISAESVRDKSLRHGHISTLHLWWARRPLAASRAVVFASLVPDPDDSRCPSDFRAAVERYLKIKVPSELKRYRRGHESRRDEDPYRPYEGMPDTLRNRLLMFIAKWSPESLAFESGKANKEPDPKCLLDDRSLVKWETSDPENVQGQAILSIARELVKVAFGGNTPNLLDPFAGGGAIPLEAGRLGCQAIANDYNPVAYLILRATCEFPQKYGKPIKRRIIQEEFGKRVKRDVTIPNALAHDFEKGATEVLERARQRIGHLYPPGKDGQQTIGYLWARTAPCSNPTCRGEIPLLRSLLVCNKKDKKVALTMAVDKVRKAVLFGIAEGKAIKATDGTMQNRGNTRCPYCEQVTPVADLRAAGLAGHMGEQIIGVITEDRCGKHYRPVEESDLEAFRAAAEITVERPHEVILPEVNTDDTEDSVSNSTGIRVHLYGMKTWGSLYNLRQLVAMQTFVSCLHEVLEAMKQEINDEAYRKAVAVYLGLWLSRTAMFQSTLGRWLQDLEAVAHPFAMQTISMTWGFPEPSPFADTSGGAVGQLDWMLRVIKRESQETIPAVVNHSDAAVLRDTLSHADVVVTDPPYFDAISFADLSDYFYIWLKRALVSDEALRTPTTPKSEETTALRHRHKGDKTAAHSHFKAKLSAAFRAARELVQPSGLVTVLFAHQDTAAWEALIGALFGAGLSIAGTWPIDTERTVRTRALDSSALASSVTVACRPRIVGRAASFKDVRKEIRQTVADAVKRFWSYGFRGADLVVACYGPAVGVFGKYERVEKADGMPVGIPELLDLAKQAARDAIAGEFRGDNLSMLYYVWANLYGAAEQPWDDARLVVQIGGDEDSAMEVARGRGIFVVDGSKCRLALLADRTSRRGLGIDQNPPLIDALHRSMLLWKEEKRRDLIKYLGERDLLGDGPFWKLAQALFEVLPRDLEDWKLVNALLGERLTLRAEGKRTVFRAAQRELSFGEGDDEKS